MQEAQTRTDLQTEIFRVRGPFVKFSHQHNEEVTVELKMSVCAERLEDSSFLSVFILPT